jgi:DNA-binding IclR family transcriptional regulator
MIAALEPATHTDANLKALTHGLDALRILSEARGPMTSTQIAERIGLHQSSASRILKALTAAGYVRKPDYHSFTVDYGVLALGSTANSHFPWVNLPRAALVALAERCAGLSVTLCTLWQNQMIYFLRAQKGHELTILGASGYPLHLSSPGMRLLLDQQEAVAIETLIESKRRYGWERPTKRVPETPAGALRAARGLLEDDCLALENWQGDGRISAAIPVVAPGHPRAALALAGPLNVMKLDKIFELLQEGRRAVEGVMADPQKTK